jgi:hypothetical protein
VDLIQQFGNLLHFVQDDGARELVWRRSGKDFP